MNAIQNLKKWVLTWALGSSLLLLTVWAQGDEAVKVYAPGEVPSAEDIAAMLGGKPPEAKVRGIVFESAADNKSVSSQSQPPAAAEPAPVRQAFALPIQFGYNSAKLLPESFPALNAVAAGIQQVPDVKLVIEGHTDAAGPDQYNQQLSQKRAEAVKNYLIQHGTHAKSLQTVGLGEARPLDPADPYAEKNRRVEFRVVP